VREISIHHGCDPLFARAYFAARCVKHTLYLMLGKR
jgi:hypothetical protein